MITIFTYLWHDGPSKYNASHQYTVEDVRLLKRMIDRNITVPYEFAVVTDRPDDFAECGDMRVVTIDWTTHVSGTCFVRLFTFSPLAKILLGDRVLQLDIDTVITRNIDHIVTRQEDIVCWRNPTRLPRENPVKPGRSWYNASVLLHRCGTYIDLWSKFDPKNPGCRDDQWWTSGVLGGYAPYFDGERDGVYRIAREDTPGSGVDGELPLNACIVTCPGSNGKADNSLVLERNPWIREHRW